MSNHKIVRLQVENVMRIKAAEVKPDGNVIVVGGKNGTGKTSLMQSIAMAMGGKDEVPLQPLRQGEEKGKIVVELENLIVTRTFTPKGSTLKVTAKDGATYSRPQTMLDELRGELTFDPLEFSRMDSKKQAETLQVLAGLDFDSMEEKRSKLHEDRKIVNRDFKTSKARLDAASLHEDTPPKEISIVALADELEEAEDTNRLNEEIRQLVNKTSDQVQAFDREIEMLTGKIQELQLGIEKTAELRKAEKSRYDRQASTVEALEDVDTSDIKQRIRDAEGTNQKVRENAAWGILKKENKTLADESAALTKKIDKIKSDKAKALREAKLPIDGLGLSVDGVTFNDLPFAQCSSAEQLRISVAMGMAMNPKLRILMIRDGSLLDEDNLAAIDKMAKDGDYQIWLEVVTDDPSKATVFIEDGTVKAPAAEEATA